MKKLILYTFFFFLNSLGFAQTIRFYGHCTDTKNKKLEDVIITIENKKTGNIIAFANTDDSGNYSLEINKQSDSITLKAAKLNYKAVAIAFNPTTNFQQNFMLETEPLILPDVVVSGNAIYRRKDTINYKAGAFSETQDKVIGDVLKRLPGIDVLPNGQILYQGKGINKYYVEGKDLLENQYGIATNNVPNNIIDKIQILENHEPKKILDSVSNSDRAAINITLKPNAKAKIIATATLGAGYAPASWNVELAAMMFKKNNQFINTYKTNNIGKNILEEVQSHLVTEDNIMDFNTTNLLSIISPSNPLPNSNRAFFNNAHIGTFNNLIKLNETYQLRINASFGKDLQTQNTTSNSTYFFANDTIKINEVQTSNNNINQLKTAFTINANSNKLYLDNKLEIEASWNTNNASITNNNVYQTLVKKPFKIKNGFNWMKKINNCIIEITSTTKYEKQPQNLLFAPGQYQDIINYGANYNAATQNATNTKFNNDTYYKFSNYKHKIKALLKLGCFTDIQNTTTNISKQLASKENIALSDSFKNNLNWQYYKPYSIVDFSYRTQGWFFDLQLPINYNLITIADNTQRNQTLSTKTLLVQPRFSVNLKTKSDFTYAFSSEITNSLGAAQDFLNGQYFANYRFLNKNGWFIPKSTYYQNTLGINYTNISSILFINSSFSYATNINNAISFRSIDSTKLETTQTVNSSTKTNQWSARFSVSKSFAKAKLTIKIYPSFSQYNTLQFQNNIAVNIQSNQYLLESNIIKNFNKKLSLNYQFKYQETNNISKNIAFNFTNAFKSISQKLDVYITSKTGLIYGIKNEYYYNSQSSKQTNNYFFSDVSIAYKFKKTNSQIELLCNNLLNTTSFTDYSFNTNSLIIDNYSLRERMFLLNYYFRF